MTGEINVKRTKWDFTPEEAEEFLAQMSEKGEEAMMNVALDIRDANYDLLREYLGTNQQSTIHVLLELSQVDKELYLVLSDIDMYCRIEMLFDEEIYLRKMLKGHAAIIYHMENAQFYKNAENNHN